MERAGSGALGDRSRTAGRPGQPVVERRRRRPGVEPQAPAVRAPTRRPNGRAAAVRALRRAALPLQLHLPRRRLAPRGAGRGGRPPRPRGAGPHRPRRLLRRGPLRRGGPGRRAAHGVRRRAHAHARLAPAGPDEARRDPGRPAGSRRHAPDPHGEHLVVLADGPAGYARLARAISHGQLAGEKGAPQFTLADAGRAPAAGHVVGAHRVPQGRGARGAGRRRARPPPAASCSRLVEAFGRDHVARRAVGPRRPARLGPQRRPRRAGRPPRRRPASPPTTSTTPRPAQRRLATALAAVRARRSLDELDAWLPAAAGAHLRSGAEQARRFARYPAWSSGPPRSGRAARVRPAAGRPDAAAVPVPRRAHDEMAYLRRARRGGRRAPLRPPAGAERTPGAWRARSTTSWRSSSSSASPATSSSCGTSSSSAASTTSTARAGAVAANSRGLLRPRHHQRRRRVARPAVRALPVARARRAARHRHRHRERPAGGGHPVRLRALRPPPRRPGGQRHHLPGQVGGAGHGQGARLRPRPAGRLVQAGRRAGATVARRPAEPARPRHPRRGARPGRGRSSTSPRHLGIHSGGMVICDRPVIEVCPVEWGRMEDRTRAAVGQGRLRRGGPGEVRPARPRACSSALHYAVDLDPRAPRRTRSTWPPSRRRTTVYDMLCRADSVGVFQVESRAQMATLPRLQAADVLRPRGRGGAHPARARSRAARCTPTSAAATARSRSPTCTRCSRTAWPRRSACRCSRSSSCRWPSTWPASRPARPTSCARPWARSAAGERDGAAARSGSTTGWPSGASPATSPTRSSTKLAAFANYGFPESHSVSFAYLVYASSWIKLPRAGGVLRGAAQRPADGLLLARTPWCRTPAATASRCAPPTSTPPLATATLEPTCPPASSRRPGRPSAPGERGRRCGSGSARCAASATTWPRRSAAGAARTPTWRTSCAGCRRSPRPARGAGHRRRVRLASGLDAARGAVGGGRRRPVPARTGWPASSPAPTPRRCRA